MYVNHQLGSTHLFYSFTLQNHNQSFSRSSPPPVSTTLFLFLFTATHVASIFIFHFIHVNHQLGSCTHLFIHSSTWQFWYLLGKRKESYSSIIRKIEAQEPDNSKDVNVRACSCTDVVLSCDGEGELVLSSVRTATAVSFLSPVAAD